MKIKSGFEVNDNIISFPGFDDKNVEGLGSTLFQKMKEHRDATAQIDGSTAWQDTYGNYLQRCVRTAVTMRKKGITSEDVISICSLNHLNTTVPLVAALFLGAKPACLDPTLSPSVTTHLLKQMRPKIIFVGPEAIKLIEEAVVKADVCTKIVIFGDSPAHHLRFSEFLQPVPDENHFRPIQITNVKDTALILFSSGTTGFPKGICLNHYGLLACRWKISNTLDLSVMLSFASIYWISSAIILITSILGGNARVVFPKFDADDTWNLIEKFKVTAFFSVPTQIISVCRNGLPKGIDVSSLKYAFTGGSAISKEKLLKIRSVLSETVVLNSYGMTELSGLALSLGSTGDPIDIELYKERPHTIGRPMAGFTYKVVNPDTEKVVGPHQPGELRIKTEFQMNGYYNFDSSSVWDSDGFLKTGDIVYYDENYSFYYMDRIKEMLQYKNLVVVPTKLEAILLTHPAVECAVVFGLPHGEDGDHPTAVVVLTKTASGKVGVEDIEKYVANRVSEGERLRGGVRIAKTIFITPTGKLSRRRMKDLVLRGEI